MGKHLRNRGLGRSIKVGVGWVYLLIDATYLKVRQAGRIVSASVISSIWHVMKVRI